MPQFHTVKDAARIVGKSPSAIRRVIHPIARDDEHPDRDQIRPTPEEVRELRGQGANFPWQISDELLRRKFPDEPGAEKGSATGNQSSADDRGLLAMLRAELEIKNQQIATQSQMMSRQLELIQGLSDRIREGNLLIGSLQQQLSLPEGGRAQPTVVDARTSKPQPEKTSAKVPAKPAPKPVKPKRGFFSRIFR